MVELIYNESENTGSSVVVNPPKNVRQIGNAGGRHKIYMEDYVYTFLHGMDIKEPAQRHGTILIGHSEVSKDIRYTFINGAIRCSDFIFQDNSIRFDEKCWEYIYKEIKNYFEREKIVGWSFGMSGFPLELTPIVEAAHRKYFSERDKVLFLSELTEKEDVFYTYEQGVLQRKEGYYIYYEKNPAMQEYMIRNRKSVYMKKTSETAMQNVIDTEHAEREEKKYSEVEDITYFGKTKKNEETGKGTTNRNDSETKNKDKKYKEFISTKHADKRKNNITNKELSGETEKDTINRNDSEIENKDKKYKGLKNQTHADKRKNHTANKEFSEETEKDIINKNDSETENKDKKYKEFINSTHADKRKNHTANKEFSEETGKNITNTKRSDKRKQNAGDKERSFLETEYSQKQDQSKNTGAFVLTEHVQKSREIPTDAEQALQNYRQMLLEKKEASIQTKRNALLYTASAAAMIVLCIIGITTVNNYEKMKQVEETLMVISENAVEKVMSETNEIIVESIPGKVTAENTALTSNDTKIDSKENIVTESDKDRKQGQMQTNTQETTEEPNREAEVKDSTQEEKKLETMAQTFLEQGYYEVQPGDKLENICMKIYRTTAMIDKVCEINQIEDIDKIYAGQKLILP